MTSPPNKESKKEELKLRSNKSKEIPTAKGGKDNNNNKEVKNKDHTNKDKLEKEIKDKFKIVVIKFIEPKEEDIPAKCKDKIEKSTEFPEEPKEDKVGYKVQPVPTPSLNKEENNNKNNKENVKTIAEYDNSDIGVEIAKKDFHTNG